MGIQYFRRVLATKSGIFKINHLQSSIHDLHWPYTLGFQNKKIQQGQLARSFPKKLPKPKLLMWWLQREWKSCTTIYFETETRAIDKKLIGLIPKSRTFINNIFYNSSLISATKPKKELLSVTVIEDQGLSETELIEAVKKELKTFCGISTTRFIKLYNIPRALPKLSDLKYEILKLI